MWVLLCDVCVLVWLCCCFFVHCCCGGGEGWRATMIVWYVTVGYWFVCLPSLFTYNYLHLESNATAGLKIKAVEALYAGATIYRNHH